MYLRTGTLVQGRATFLHDTHTYVRTYIHTYKRVLKQTSCLFCIATDDDDCIVILVVSVHSTFGSILNSWLVKSGDR